MTDVRHINAGHRARMRQKYAASGPDAFLPHELLEMLLFAPIPYRDTNPVAHRLLERFGSIDAVLSAPTEELCEVPGVGESTAAFLHAAAEIGLRALCESEEPTAACTDYRTFGEMLVRRLAGEPCESARLYLLDPRFTIVGERRLSGLLDRPSFSLREVVSEAMNERADMLILASCHVGRPAAASDGEADQTRILAERLDFLGIRLLEHYVIAGHHYTGVLYNNRRYLEKHPDLWPFYFGTAKKEADT